MSPRYFKLAVMFIFFYRRLVRVREPVISIDAINAIALVVVIKPGDDHQPRLQNPAEVWRVATELIRAKDEVLSKCFGTDPKKFAGAFHSVDG